MAPWANVPELNLKDELLRLHGLMCPSLTCSVAIWPFVE